MNTARPGPLSEGYRGTSGPGLGSPTLGGPEIDNATHLIH